MLMFWVLTSKFRSVIMFVFPNMQKKFHCTFVDKLMDYAKSS
jgi:hypothetical protein